MATPTRKNRRVRSSESGSSDSRDALRLHVRLATCTNLLMRESRKRIAERWSLTLPQFDVLAELARAGRDGFTFVELSRLLLVTSGNLTGIVDRLEAQGLVKRQPGQHDRRIVRVKLTPKGRAMTRRMLPRLAVDIADILSFFPREAMLQLTDLLGRLREGLRHLDNAVEAAPRQPSREA